MDLQLTNDVAVVVGGARGIGGAICRAFAREGARVAVLDRDPEVPARAAELSAEFKVPARGYVSDVTDYDGLRATAGEIVKTFGRLDHVVCAAAIGSGKFGFPFWNLAPADWPRVLEVDLLGSVNVAHAFSPALVEVRRGTLLFIVSVAGQMGSQTDPPYSASKAAVINFVQVAAKDLGSYGVRVNAISPGMVKTALNESVWAAWNAQQPPELQRSYEDWAGEKARRVAPLGRWQEPDDIAHMAVFLASPRAQNVTGQTINVDGGQVMHS